MQKDVPLMITRWNGVFLVKDGKVVDSIPIEGDVASKLLRKLQGKTIEEETLALEKWQGSKIEPYHFTLPYLPEDRKTIRELAFAVAERALAGAFTGDEDIIWGVRVLDEMKDQLNTLKELAGGWELVHSLSKTESEGVAHLGALVKEIERTVSRLERFVEVRMHQIAPSVCEACGPILGARLIEAVGGLMRLAMKPSSTVQVLGAERALFRHLRTGAPPPKHGLIFQHPSIQGAPRRDRGRRARALASKITMAVRKDAIVSREAKALSP
jgi:nucleolar protein 56